MRRFFKFVTANASLLISLCSFLVALTSLTAAILSQRLDIQYKEASIMPRLTMFPNASNFSYALSNIGAGPAVIKAVSFSVSGHCYRISENATWPEEAENQFINDVKAHVYDKVLAPLMTPGKPLNAVLSTNTITPRHVLRPGDKFILFEIDQRSLSKIEELDYLIVANKRSEFIDTSVHIPLHVDYCSVTGWHCEGVGIKQGPCDE